MKPRQIRYMSWTLDISLCVLLAVFVILVNLGSFNSPRPLQDVVVKYNNSTLNVLPTVIHLSHVPTSIVYDLTTFAEGCTISDIQYFQHCGIKQRCSSIVYTFYEKTFTLNIRAGKQYCTFSGFVRFVNAGQRL